MKWIRNTFEISHTAHRSNLAMEGIRGFAVFLVFLVHYVTLVEPWVIKGSATYVVSEHLRGIGNVGVDLFFVLSGYLIYGMLIRKKVPFSYYFYRRIQRIYPVFTAVFLLYLALSAIFPSESKIPGGWDGLVFVIQNYLLLPGLFDIDPIITVAWSLSYEFFYYLSIPLIIVLLRMRSWPPRRRIIFILFSSALLFLYFSIYEGPIRLVMFVSGILLFETARATRVRGIPPVGLPALSLAIFSVILMNGLDANGWWKYAMLYGLFFIFCMECLFSDGIASKVFSFAPMRWLGNMSYSYYLIHGLALKFLFLFVVEVYPAQHEDIALFWLLLPVAFFFTLIPSALLFVFIEKPFSLVRKKKVSGSTYAVSKGALPQGR